MKALCPTKKKKKKSHVNKFGVLGIMWRGRGRAPLPRYLRLKAKAGNAFFFFPRCRPVLGTALRGETLPRPGPSGTETNEE